MWKSLFSLLCTEYLIVHVEIASNYFSEQTNTQKAFSIASRSVQSATPYAVSGDILAWLFALIYIPCVLFKRIILPSITDMFELFLCILCRLDLFPIFSLRLVIRHDNMHHNGALSCSRIGCLVCPVTRIHVLTVFVIQFLFVRSPLLATNPDFYQNLFSRCTQQPASDITSSFECHVLCSMFISGSFQAKRMLLSNSVISRDVERFFKFSISCSIVFCSWTNQFRPWTNRKCLLQRAGIPIMLVD